jgi:sugar phosphate permease
VATVFATYATYYFCRQNIAAALPAMQQDLGLTKTDLGQVTMALFIGYAIGQLIFGALADRHGPRWLLLGGMLISAGLNLAFAFSRPMVPMIALWGLNGFFQATGFPSTTKTIANWFPPRQRGRVSAIRGADYPLGSLLVMLLAGWLAEYHGWRWAFIVPAAILAISAIHTFLRLRGAPEDVGLPSAEQQHGGEGNSAAGAFNGWRYLARMTVRNPRIWVLAVAFFGVTITRYGFGMWAVTYLTEQGASISRAAAISAVIFAGGIAGNFIAGWLTDVRLGGRRAPIVVPMLLLLSALSAIFPLVPVEATLLLVIYLAAVGACTYAPDMLICHTMAMDIATRKAAASASGFINFFGSAGAALSVGLTGYLAETIGWSSVVGLWAGGAALAALMVATLWNVRGGHGEWV